MEKISCEGLSQLQRLILVMLCEPKLAVRKRRAFNQAVKRLYWGNEGPTATASLCRALWRLEERGLIVGALGRWELTSDPYGANGVGVAFLAWARSKEFYARFGLKGPPLEALGLSGGKKAPGVHVALDCSTL